MTKLSTGIAEVMQHVRHMAATMPYRKSGLGQDVVAGRYVVDVLRSYGLEADLQEFESYDSDPGEASLELVDPERRAIETRPCLHIEPTPPEGYRGELIDLGSGGEADYLGKDVRGKIALAEVSYAPATPEKARLAAKHGAAGLLLMNWGRGDEADIPWRALKAVWGNPTPESWGQIPRLFGLSISRRDGAGLRALLAKGKVELLATVTGSRVWRKLYQPIAWLRAPTEAPERDNFIIVSGHIDSWNPGVTDNITGDAAMMEVARVLAARRSALRRSVVFCFWNGHEVAEAAGSAHFVDALWEDINRNAVAYTNINSVGMKGTSTFDITASPELSAFADRVARDAFGNSLPIRVEPLSRTGDQSFFGVGVPAVTARHGYDERIVREYHGATLGWYNHTEYDTLDIVDEAILAKDVEYWAEVIRRLAESPVLPTRFAPRIADLKAQFARLLRDRRDPANLGIIHDQLEELASHVAAFDAQLDRLDGGGDAKTVLRGNKIALRLSRLLTFISGSASGKYDQDSYGISTLASAVPFLAVFEDFQRFDPDGLDAKLLTTKLVRMRHVITDALEATRAQLADWEAERA